MNWRRIEWNSAISECGCYRMDGAFRQDCFFWDGVCVATSKLVASSDDKDFVKLRCEIHRSQTAPEGQVWRFK